MIVEGGGEKGPLYPLNSMSSVAREGSRVARIHVKSFWSKFLLPFFLSNFILLFLLRESTQNAFTFVL